MNCCAMRPALLLLAVAAVAQLDFAAAGVRTAKLEYPGKTGAFPS